MKKKFLTFVLAALLAVLFIEHGAGAQTRTQQDPQRLDAAQMVATSATSAATITITPPAGQSVYITNVEVTNCAGGTAVTAATPTSLTTTNLNGAAWTIGSGVTAGLCQPSPINGPFPLALKSAQPGVAVTFVLPTFATNQTVRVSVYYYFGA